MTRAAAINFLMGEAGSLLTRLERLRAFSLQMPMVPAAAISPEALLAIERSLAKGHSELGKLVREYIRWLRAEGRDTEPSDAQRKLAIIRIRFNDILSQLDIFADVFNQRSEHDTGVWLSGLDMAAADALRLPARYYAPPPVICYLDRGQGAAIRRARTRLPGGDESPVAIVRVPRERMIGSGVASSLFHEVGHQGSALLDLVNSIKPVLAGMNGKPAESPWVFWGRWISEIIADFWALSRLGIGATLGLIGVVGLPRAFVFRMALDDPHPFPWIRVKLGCAMGDALYPHPQWERLSDLWESLYPVEGLGEEPLDLLSSLTGSMPEFLRILLSHRPASLGGKSLSEVFRMGDRQPVRLRAHYESWRADPMKPERSSPSLVFAVLGQAKADGKMTPEAESEMLGRLLRKWALESALAPMRSVPRISMYKAFA